MYVGNRATIIDLSVCWGSVTPNIQLQRHTNQSINIHLHNTHSPNSEPYQESKKRLKVEKRKKCLYYSQFTHKKRNIKKELFDKNLIPISISRSRPRVLLQKYVK